MLHKTIGTNKKTYNSKTSLIIDNDEIKNLQTIAKTFNHYFANKGKKMADVIKQKT